MADQHNDNIPALSNQIVEDVPDIKENLEFHKDVFQNFVNSWSNSDSSDIYPAVLKRTTITDASSPYTMLETDIIIQVNASAGAVTLNLLPAATLGVGRLVFIKLANGGYDLTITPDGSELIDAESSIVLSTENDSIALYCTGTGFRIKYLHQTVSSVVYGGTGAATLTDHGILVGSGTSAVTPLAVMTNGQIVVGATGADPAPQTLSGDATLNASGVLTLTTNAVETANITDANVTTAKLATGAATGEKLSKTIVSSGSQALATETNWTPSAGVYMLTQTAVSSASVGIGLYVSGTWRYGNDGVNGLSYFDGTNQRVRNSDALISTTVYYQTF